MALPSPRAPPPPLQLGTGNETSLMERSPVPVAGGQAWSAITVGGDATCGLTAAQKAYCWGLGQWSGA